MLLLWFGCLASFGVCVSLLFNLLVLFLFCESYLSFGDLSPSLSWLLSNPSHSFLGFPAHYPTPVPRPSPPRTSFWLPLRHPQSRQTDVSPPRFSRFTSTLYSRPVAGLSHITVVKLWLPSPRLLSFTVSSRRVVLVVGVL